MRKYTEYSRRADATVRRAPPDTPRVLVEIRRLAGRWELRFYRVKPREEPAVVLRFASWTAVRLAIERAVIRSRD